MKLRINKILIGLKSFTQASIFLLALCFLSNSVNGAISKRRAEKIVTEFREQLNNMPSIWTNESFEDNVEMKKSFATYKTLSGEAAFNFEKPISDFDFLNIANRSLFLGCPFFSLSKHQSQEPKANQSNSYLPINFSDEIYVHVYFRRPSSAGGIFLLNARKIYSELRTTYGYKKRYDAKVKELEERLKDDPDNGHLQFDFLRYLYHQAHFYGESFDPFFEKYLEYLHKYLYKIESNRLGFVTEILEGFRIAYAENREDVISQLLDLYLINILQHYYKNPDLIDRTLFRTPNSAPAGFDEVAFLMDYYTENANSSLKEKVQEILRSDEFLYFKPRCEICGASWMDDGYLDRLAMVSVHYR